MKASRNDVLIEPRFAQMSSEPPPAHELLVAVVQELSLARSMEAIQAIVRRAARQLTGADGATFVLRDGDCCHYVDEDAIGPLWKGNKFPLEICISGWVMNHAIPVTIEDVFADPRIPHDVYRATFVKSLTMAPIRQRDPLGAIGAYWARHHEATAAEQKLLAALADSTSIAIENVHLYEQLEDRVAERTAELAAANRELESFTYSVSHDLRAPLRAIGGFAQAVLEDASDGLDETSRNHLGRVVGAAERMNGLIDALLEVSRVHRGALVRSTVDVTALARELGEDLALREPSRVVELVVQEGLRVEADPRLFRVILDNLVGNAWKFTARAAAARIEIGAEDGVIFVRDNGAGFAMSRADRLFAPFQRLHTEEEFPGTGIGLATVARVVRRHGGEVTIDSAPNAGTTVRVRI